jgi:hypothetical protein
MRARSALCAAIVSLAAVAARGAHAEEARAAFSVGARVVRSARIQVAPAASGGAVRVEVDAGGPAGELAGEEVVDGTRVVRRTVAVPGSTTRTRDGHLLVTVFPDGEAPSLQVRD